jgi:hypothetical protein
MRAVRADRAALLPRGAGFLRRAAALGAFAAAPDFFADPDFVAVELFVAADDFVDAVPGGTGFFVDLAFDEVVGAGLTLVSPDDCAATGVTTISADKKPASKRLVVR